MNEYTPEILIVLFHTMIKLFNVSLIQKPQNLLLQLPTAFARDDLDEFDLPLNRFFNDPVEFRIDLVASVVDVMQVKFEFCHGYLIIPESYGYFIGYRLGRSDYLFTFIALCDEICAGINRQEAGHAIAVREPDCHIKRTG